MHYVHQIRDKIPPNLDANTKIENKMIIMFHNNAPH